jgi:hypothetical protein
MCLKCTQAHLEQLRWELVVQEHELQGLKPSFEIVESVKDRIKANGGKPMLPRIKLERPDDMDDQHYQEACVLFKEGLLHRRKVEIAAIELVSNLLENEVFQPFPVLKVSAGVILNGGDEDDDTETADTD